MMSLQVIALCYICMMLAVPTIIYLLGSKVEEVKSHDKYIYSAPTLKPSRERPQTKVSMGDKEMTPIGFKMLRIEPNDELTVDGTLVSQYDRPLLSSHGIEVIATFPCTHYKGNSLHIGDYNFQCYNEIVYVTCTKPVNIKMKRVGLWKRRTNEREFPFEPATQAEVLYLQESLKPKLKRPSTGCFFTR